MPDFQAFRRVISEINHLIIVQISLGKKTEANFLKTTARAVVKLNPSLAPKEIAALADAGLTAYHAVKKSVAILYPGTKAVVIGAGGLGHIGIQQQVVTDKSVCAQHRRAIATQL